MKCKSCEMEIVKGVRFPCPKCKKEVVRCNKCRTLSIEYTCDCSYQGP